jgi:hypothetical protein
MVLKRHLNTGAPQSYWRRGEVFARWLAAEFPERALHAGVLDVAGGRGTPPCLPPSPLTLIVRFTFSLAPYCSLPLLSCDPPPPRPTTPRPPEPHLALAAGDLAFALAARGVRTTVPARAPTGPKRSTGALCTGLLQEVTSSRLTS